jgi:hypothetical protein
MFLDQRLGLQVRADSTEITFLAGVFSVRSDSHHQRIRLSIVPVTAIPQQTGQPGRQSRSRHSLSGDAEVAFSCA